MVGTLGRVNEPQNQDYLSLDNFIENEEEASSVFGASSDGKPARSNGVWY